MCFLSLYLSCVSFYPCSLLFYFTFFSILIYLLFLFLLFSFSIRGDFLSFLLLLSIFLSPCLSLITFSFCLLFYLLFFSLSLLIFYTCYSFFLLFVCYLEFSCPPFYPFVSLPSHPLLILVSYSILFLFSLLFLCFLFFFSMSFSPNVFLSILIHPLSIPVPPRILLYPSLSLRIVIISPSVPLTAFEDDKHHTATTVTPSRHYHTITTTVTIYCPPQH